MARPEYVAQRTLRDPVTDVIAYQPGDPVAQGVVDNWQLEVGADGDVLPLEGTLLAKPAKNAARAAWVAYALAQGMAEADVEDMGRDELVAHFEALEAAADEAVTADGG